VEARGSCPEPFLVGRQVFQKRREEPILGIFSGLKLSRLEFSRLKFIAID
jgi:hypothetical protein